MKEPRAKLPRRHAPPPEPPGPGPEAGWASPWGQWGGRWRHQTARLPVRRLPASCRHHPSQTGRCPKPLGHSGPPRRHLWTQTRGWAPQLAPGRGLVRCWPPAACPAPVGTACLSRSREGTQPVCVQAVLPPPSQPADHKVTGFLDGEFLPPGGQVQKAHFEEAEGPTPPHPRHPEGNGVGWARCTASRPTAWVVRAPGGAAAQAAHGAAPTGLGLHPPPPSSRLSEASSAVCGRDRYR